MKGIFFIASAEDDEEEKASKSESKYLIKSSVKQKLPNTLYNSFCSFFTAQVTIEGVIVQKADCRPVQPSADYMRLKK